MSLAQDYQMYYSETFVSFEDRHGAKVPFLVMEVRWQNNEPDDPWDNRHVNQLKFRGHTIVKDEDNYDFSERMVWKTWDELDFDVPDMGYYEVRGMDRPLWLAAMPQRSTKKGFTLRKSNHGRNLDRRDQNKIVYECFNDKRSYFQKNFWFDGRNVDYKGIRIGQYEVHEDGTKHLRGLNRHADYLREMIEEGFNAEQQSNTVR